MSYKTSVMLHRKHIKTDKEFLPITSQVWVLLWGFFASAKRVMAIVAVFIPSLGLFNVLHHWQAEQIPFWMRRSKAKGYSYGLGHNDTLELNGLTETVYWRDLDRTNWTDPQHPVFAPYTLYTGLTLGQTFIAFILLFFLHLVAIITVKIFTADKIKIAGKFELLRHSLENMNIPVPYEDFALRTGEINDYRERRGRVNREMSSLILVNFIVNTLMLTPLIYTGMFLDCLYRDTSLGPPHVTDVMLISHDHMSQPESIIHCVDQSDCPDASSLRALFKVECHEM